MKNTLSIIFALLLIISVLCGCAKDSFDSEKTTTTTTLTEAPTPTTEVKVQTDGSLTAEAAVQIYMDNIDVWKYESETPQWYGYLFLDLNSDGVMELVKTEVSGYEQKSNNNYYRIDTDTNTVVEIPFPDKDEENQCDFNGLDYPDLYKNNSTGKLRFMTYDHHRLEGVDSITTIGELYMDETFTIKARNLWSVSFDIDEETYAVDSVVYEVFDAEGNKETVSEETYLGTLDTYEKENTNLNLQFKTVEGHGDGTIDSKAFAELDEASQYNRLLESYNAYKY